MLSEATLLEKAYSLEGMSFLQLATHLNWTIPALSIARKGWTGSAIEAYLGGEAPTKAGPDFVSLGIELKTMPLNPSGKPSESTFITSVPLLTLHQETWETSTCYAKLRRILWVPVEGGKHIEFVNRRIGRALLWSPDGETLAILKQDWQELTSMMLLGQLHDIHAGLGRYLQVRPKAAHGKSLRYAHNQEGRLQQTLPRGFYLRALFTERVFKN